mgnify:CR=1 FL=1
MTKPMYRSNSYRKIEKRSGSNRHVTHYERRKTSMPHCALCGKELNGINNSKFVPKSLRTVERKFGGTLCANCTSKIIKLASRIERGELKLSDVSLREKDYILQLVSH